MRAARLAILPRAFVNQSSSLPWSHSSDRQCSISPFSTSCASFCRRTGACRICSQPLFRISRNQGVTHWTLQAKSCAKGMLPLACRLGQVLQNVLHLRSPLATRTPLETQEKRPSTALLVLGRCADPLEHGVLQKLLLIYSIPRA